MQFIITTNNENGHYHENDDDDDVDDDSLNEYSGLQGKYCFFIYSYTLTQLTKTMYLTKYWCFAFNIKITNKTYKNKTMQ